VAVRVGGEIAWLNWAGAFQTARLRGAEGDVEFRVER
jgi:hypothetical protein